MAASVTEVEQLREYMTGVMERADHHANNVNEVVLALIGAIVWKKDPETQIEVREGKGGKLANVLWVVISGSRYTFSYNRDVGAVEMRLGGQTGEPLHLFSNSATLEDVKKVFANL